MWRMGHIPSPSSVLEAQRTGEWGRAGNLVAALSLAASCPHPAPPQVNRTSGKLQAVGPAMPGPPAVSGNPHTAAQALWGSFHISQHILGWRFPLVCPPGSSPGPIGPGIPHHAGFCHPAEAKALDALVPTAGVNSPQWLVPSGTHELTGLPRVHSLSSETASGPPTQGPCKLESKEAPVSWATAGVWVGLPPASLALWDPEFLMGRKQAGPASESPGAPGPMALSNRSF